MIKVDNLNKKFGRQQVLKDVCLEFGAGQSVALIGPNGSGKTTLIKVLLGLVLPNSGMVNFDGQPIAGDSNYRRMIGYMPQMSRYPGNMKVGQLFSMMKSLRSDVSADKYDMDLYRAFDIDSMAGKRLEVLSGGMKQKVSASLAFMFDPSVLILDEPTAGLDPVSNEVLKEKLKTTVSEDKLVLITSHILNDLDDITTHVAYLMDGLVKFYKSLDQLKRETAESRLNRIIAQVLSKEKEYVEDH